MLQKNFQLNILPALFPDSRDYRAYYQDACEGERQEGVYRQIVEAAEVRAHNARTAKDVDAPRDDGPAPALAGGNTDDPCDEEEKGTYVAEQPSIVLFTRKQSVGKVHPHSDAGLNL